MKQLQAPAHTSGELSKYIFFFVMPHIQKQNYVQQHLQQCEAARSPEEPWPGCYLIQGDRKYGQEI